MSTFGMIVCALIFFVLAALVVLYSALSISSDLDDFEEMILQNEKNNDLS